MITPRGLEMELKGHPFLFSILILAPLQINNDG